MEKGGSQLEHMLEAAWAGEEAVKVAPQARSPPVAVTPPREVQPNLEAAAVLMEKLVSDMDTLTSLLQSMERRMERTEQETAELRALLGGA